MEKIPGLQTSEERLTHAYICTVLCEAYHLSPLAPQDFRFTLQQTQGTWHTTCMPNASQQQKLASKVFIIY